MQHSSPANLRLRRSAATFRQWRYLVLAPMFSWATITASADDAALSVPVRILGAVQPAPPMDPMIPAREPAPAATPAARMPQYQLHHKDVGDPGDPDSPQLRFVLAMPEQPLLIEAAVFIDGQPFRQAREKRVQEIMRYIADPEAFKAEANRILAAAQAEAAAKNAPGLVESIATLVTGNATANVPAAPEPEVGPVPPESPPTDEVQPEDTTPEASATPAIAEVPAEPAVPAVPKYAAPETIYERIDRYTQSTGAPLSVEEVRWLLTNWVDGPLLLFLNDNFQRFRADQ
ncbi:MAG: hypothetical protein WKF77_32015, partial [Planctomycetaceae bacterium]